MAITKNIINVSVDNRFVAVDNHTQITAGNVGVDFVAIELDAEWEGLKSFVTFAGCAQDPTTLDYAAELEVPWEQIAEDCDLYIGIQGFDPSADVSIDAEGQIITNGIVPVLNAMAMTVPIKVRESGASSGVTPTDPTPGTLQRVEQDILALEGKSKELEDIVNESVDSEAARVAAENKRVAAENARVAAEKERASAEQTRIGNENARKANEQTRESNESTRKSNEQERIGNENARKANETSRMSAEQIRVSAENERKDEFLRQLADWQAQVDATAIASLMSSVRFRLSDAGDLECVLPVSAGYAFRLNENGDLEVVG